MKTIVEFLDGHIEQKEDCCPSFDLLPADDADQLGPSVCLLNAASENISDNVPLNFVRRVVFEP